MRFFSRSYLVFTLVFFGSAMVASTGSLDSLGKILRVSKEDTNKIELLNKISWEFKNNDPDSAIVLGTTALTLEKKLLVLTNDPEFKERLCLKIARTENNLGIFFRNKGNYADAQTHNFSSLAIYDDIEKNSPRKKLMLDKLRSKTIGNAGTVYYYLSNYPKALEFDFKALKLASETNDKQLETNTLGVIGIIYMDQGDYKNALDYEMKALKVAKELNDKVSLARHLGNIGNIFNSEAGSTRKGINNDSLHHLALNYHLRALHIDEELGDKASIARHFTNIGLVHDNMQEYDTALFYYYKGLKVNESIGNANGIPIQYGNIGEAYMAKKDFVEAEKNLLKAQALSMHLGALLQERNWCWSLTKLYEMKKEWTKAFVFYKKYISAGDSISNDENVKKQTQTEMQFQFDKQQTADSIKNTEAVEQEQLKHEQEIKQQKIYTYGGAIGFMLMLIVAGVSFRAYRQKRSANEIISLQKKLVEMKQKEIIDSINYASRIQKSLLPSEAYINKALKKLIHNIK